MMSMRVVVLTVLSLSQSSTGWILPQKTSHLSNARLTQKSSPCLYAQSDEADRHQIQKKLFGVLGHSFASMSVTAALILGGPTAHASDEVMAPQISNENSCNIVQLSQREAEVSEDAPRGANADEAAPSQNEQQDSQKLVVSENGLDEEVNSPSEETQPGENVLAEAPTPTGGEEHNTFESSSEEKLDEETLVATSETATEDEERTLQAAADTDAKLSKADSEGASIENTELLASSSSSSKEKQPQLAEASTESEETQNDESKSYEGGSAQDSILVPSSSPSTAEKEPAISEASANSD